MTRNFSVHGSGEIEAVPVAGTVEEHERLAAAGGEHGGLDAIDGVSLAFESSHGSGGPSRVSFVLITRRRHGARLARVPRMRGMTSSAIRLRFFTTFQCGMLPTAPRMLKWLVPIVSPHSLELIDDLVGRADRDEERFVDRLEVEAAVQLVGQRGARLQLIDREVAGRSEKFRRRAQRILEEIADVPDPFLLGLFLRLGDVGDDAERHLVGPDVVAVFGGALAQLVD